MKSFLIWSVVVIAGLWGLAVLSSAQDSQKQQRKSPTEAPRDEKLTFDIEGVECARCAAAMKATLSDARVELDTPLMPNAAGPSRVMVTCSQTCDLARLAKEVQDTKTPHRDKVEPALYLVLFAKLDDEAAKNAKEALAKIDGVDPKGSKVNSDRGEIELQISTKTRPSTEPLTPYRIATALRRVGIEARTVKSAGAIQARRGAGTIKE